MRAEIPGTGHDQSPSNHNDPRPEPPDESSPAPDPASTPEAFVSVTPMLEAALDYVGRAWWVFPVHGIRPDGRCTCGGAHTEDKDAGKHPVLDGGLRNATNKTDRVRHWWGSEEGRYWNVAIVTGKKSGITVIDVDIGDGKAGAETWGELIAEQGEPDTLSSTTGSGGMHFFFLFNSILKTSTNTLGPGIDVRNDGGYVVGVPSRHRSGGTYYWNNEGTALDHLPAHLSVRKETRGRPKGSKAGQGKNRKYTLEEVRDMLGHIDASDRDDWRHVGIILGREFERSDEAWEMYQEWSTSWGGKEGRNHVSIMRQAFYEESQKAPTAGGSLSIGSIVAKAKDGGWVSVKGQTDPDNFIYYAPDNDYFYRPTRHHWPEASVNHAVGELRDDAGNVVAATTLIRRRSLATSMASDPLLEGTLIKGFDCDQGSVTASPGGAIINTYRAPKPSIGNPEDVQPFLDHVRRIFNQPGDSEQFLNYMAHRVQCPGEKARFALLIAGPQGNGKDTAVDLCMDGIGAWNVANIDPAALEERFNEYEAKVLVRISETSNLHEMNKWAFNEKTKTLIAGRPDHIDVNPKYGTKFGVRRHSGVILTTNHLATGIYIPADDRRYDVIASANKEEMGIGTDALAQAYFEALNNWADSGGRANVAAYLAIRDISAFNPNTGQRKTAAHRSVVAAGMSSEHWIVDALALLGDPKVVRSDALLDAAVKETGLPLKDLAHRLQSGLARLKYHQLHNDTREDGRWYYPSEKKRTIVYRHESMSIPDAASEAVKLVKLF